MQIKLTQTRAALDSPNATAAATDGPLFHLSRKLGRRRTNAQNQQGAINDLHGADRRLAELYFGSSRSRRKHRGAGPSGWWSARKLQRHIMGRKCGRAQTTGSNDIRQ